MFGRRLFIPQSHFAVFLVIVDCRQKKRQNIITQLLSSPQSLAIGDNRDWGKRMVTFLTNEKCRKDTVKIQ